jgi:hypothetical protein
MGVVDEPLARASDVQARPKPTNIDEAILAVQGSSTALDLRRNAEAEKGSARFRRYLDYPKLLRELRPVLQRFELTWQTFPTTMEDGAPALRYVVTFVPARETQEGVMRLMLDKQTSQAQGSALTYAKRYALQGVFDLAPDGDDDGEAASRPERPAPVDPEAPMGNVEAMLEAIAEKGLQREKVFAQAGIKDDETITIAHGERVAAILRGAS